MALWVFTGNLETVHNETKYRTVAVGKFCPPEDLTDRVEMAKWQGIRNMVIGPEGINM